MSKKKYSLKNVISDKTDPRLEGKKGSKCYAAQSASRVLELALEEDESKLYTFEGVSESEFWGPFSVSSRIGMTDTYFLIFKKED